MKQFCYVMIFFLCSFQMSFAQVGIGNSDPKATLDITASNSATPSRTDGILIPRIDAFPSTDPGADQNGMMVFLTTNSKFYYWNWDPSANGGLGAGTWDSLKNNWVDNGLDLSPTTGATKDVSIGGTNNTSSRLTIRSDKNITGLFTNTTSQDWYMWGVNSYMNNASTDINSQTIGNYNDILTAAGAAYGDYNNVRGTGDGTHYGELNLLSGTGDGIHFGVSSVLSGMGSGTQYGMQNTINNTGSGDHTGVSNNIGGAGSGAQIGVRNNINNTGNSFHTGVWNSLNGLGSGSHIANFNILSGDGTGIHYGTYNSLSGIGTGGKYGSYNKIETSAGGQHYGMYSEALKPGAFAGYFLGKVTVGTTDANRYSLPASRGTNGQVMQTDGSGNATWIDTNTIGVQKINDLSDGKSDSDGTQNGSSIFLGENAGNVDDSTNNNNIGMGYFALASNTEGERNTALGVYALSSNIGGDNNIGIGYSSMLLNETGSANISIGENSLRSNKAGNFNTSIGYYTLSNNVGGANNLALGNQSLLSNVSGLNNIGIGSFSLLTNETGNNNIAFGYQAGANLTSGNNNIILGGNSISFPVVTGSNQLNIGNLVYGTGLSGTGGTLSPGKIGIGVKAPAEKLDVNGALKIGTTTNSNSGAIRWTGTDFEGYDGSTWKSFTSILDDTSPAWYNEGTSTNATVSTSDIIRTGNIGLGVTNANASLDIFDTRGVTSINIATDDISGFSNTDSHGIKMILDNDNNTLSTGDTYAIENTVEVVTGSGYGIKNNLKSISGTSPTVYGSYQNIQSNALGWAIGYGTYNIVDANFATGYGSFNKILGDGYGVYSSATETSAFAGYFLGRFSIGTTTSNNYIMPLSRGTTGQVMQTDGTGNLSWVNETSIGIEKINDLSDGKSDNDGSQNGSSIFLGINAGSSDTSEDNFNIGIGFEAMKSTTNGKNNVSLGWSSLKGNSQGGYNTAVGSQALIDNSGSSNYNTAIGNHSMWGNRNGSNNTAVGSNSLDTNFDGNENTAIGNLALEGNGEGDYNTSIGSKSLQLLTGGLGDGNIAIGYKAGDNLTTGINNIIIGTDRDLPDPTGSYQLNIGDIIYGISVNGASGGGNIGISKANPDEKLDVNGNIRLSRLTGGALIKSDDNYSHLSDNNIDFGDPVDAWMVSSQENTNENSGIYGDRDFVTVWAPADGGRMIRFVDEDQWADNDGDPYNNTAELAYIDAAGQYVQASDRNRKQSIQRIPNALEKVISLNGYTYEYKLSASEIQKGNRPVKTSGVIAQELYEVLPEAVQINEHGEYFVHYAGVIPLLIEAIKEQQKEISELKKLEERIIALENKN